MKSVVKYIEWTLNSTLKLLFYNKIYNFIDNFNYIKKFIYQISYFWKSYSSIPIEYKERILYVWLSALEVMFLQKKKFKTKTS